MRLVNKMANLLLFAILIALVVFLAWKNYTPETFLIGWDSLHPEFNFSEAFKRVFFGVWREEQGLGVIAAHSHVADLPRIILLYLSSFIFSVSFLRWSYIFLCLALGPLGIYFFLNYVFKREKEGLGTNLAAFLGALVYLLNLCTLQHFYLPFEMFVTHFAYLPWLFFFALRFLRENGRKNLLAFAILTVLSSPQAYAAALFYAFFGALVPFVLAYRFKRGLIIILVTLLLNSYWLLPNIYSITQQSSVVINSRINQLFSPEVEIRSLGFSDLPDVLIYKGFLFDWRVFDFQKNQFTDLMETWSKHLSAKYVIYIFYAAISFSILGLIIGLRKRDKLQFSMLLVFLYSLFFLTSTNYFDNSLIKESLRIPFTKFSIIFLFSTSFFFGFCFFKFFRKPWLGIILTLIISGGLVYSVLPMFEGNLLSPVVKTSLPNEYTKLFTWFKDRPGRIAALPLYSMWGWDYHNWKYEGSDFMTYGLANPLLIRDFDRWSPFNETFYNEAAHALYYGDNEAFERTLQKYQVKYLLLDESIVNAGGSEKLLFVPKIKTMLNTSKHIKELQRFSFLTVYETDFDIGSEFVSAYRSYTSVNTDLTYSEIDPLYEKYGDYIQAKDGIGYPFVNFDPRGPVKVSLSPGLNELIFENKNAASKVIFPVKEKIIEDFGQGRGFEEAQNCDLNKIGTVSKTHQSGGILYKAEGGGVTCDYYAYGGLVHNQAYVIRIKGENRQGRSLKVYLQNWETGRMDLEELLPLGSFDSFFIILPKLDGKKGYTLNLETRSFGRIASENLIENIEIYPFDIHFLTSLIQNPENEVKKSNHLKLEGVKKIGTALYEVRVTGDGLLVLGQAFENGWLTYPKFTHVKINSWANGWIVTDSPGVIYIFFWPQLLEWGGMVLGLAALAIIVLDTRRE